MPETDTSAPPSAEQIAKHPSLADAPEPVVKAASAQKLTPEEERSALDWFLQPQAPLRYRVPVQFDTPAGQQSLIFVIRSIPQDDMERIENRNRKGDGPLAEYDDFQANVEIVGEALVSIADDQHPDGITPNDPRVTHGLPNVAEALKARFYYQPGLLANVAAEIRRISGWGTDRVGRAERVLTAAVGNS